MGSNIFYTKLAKYYDKIYHYIDYEKQSNFFIELISKFSRTKNNKILDITCGTGIHADLLQKKGFDVTGLDIIKEMIEEARKKNDRVKFIEGDMSSFSIKERFGVIICFFNSILYNENIEEMKKTLLNFLNHLEDGGILIFDTVDKSIGINSEKEKYSYSDGNLNIDFMPQWKFNKKDNIMKLEIDFKINGEELHDHHIMGAFSIRELKDIVEGIGFKVNIIERRFDSIEKLKPSSKTAIFLCQR